MLTLRLDFPAMLRALTLLGLFILAGSLHAAQGGFSATLSVEQKNSIGLATLADDEREALDRLIAVEVSIARQDSANELAGDFATRRTPDERQQAGLERLTPTQLAELNAVVASAIAASPKPKERPRIKDSDVFTPQRKPEVHGEISLTYGRSSGGGDFRAASMWVDYFDPNTGLGLGVGISSFKGNGFNGFYPGYFGSPFSSFSDFGYYGYDSPYRSFGRDYSYSEDTRSLSLSKSWNGGFRRR